MSKMMSDWNPKKLLSLKVNYKPTKIASQFHSDHKSGIKLLVGGLGVGTTTANILEMLMSAGKTNLLVVSSHDWFIKNTWGAIGRWTWIKLLGMTDTEHCYLCEIGGKEWHVIPAFYADDRLANLPEFDCIAVGSMEFTQEVFDMLHWLRELCKGTGQVFGEFKPGSFDLPFNGDATIYRYPEPILMDENNEPMINPELETWHMPFGGQWFLDVYNTRSKL